MSYVFATVTQCKKALSDLDGWLAKAAAHAKAKSFDPNVLLAARLPPRQYPLVRQVQSACDSAKFAAARLSAKEAPKHPDTEKTIEELHNRTAACTTFLGTLTAKDFEGADARRISLPFFEQVPALKGKTLSGTDYLV